MKDKGKLLKTEFSESSDFCLDDLLRQDEKGESELDKLFGIHKNGLRKGQMNIISCPPSTNYSYNCLQFLLLYVDKTTGIQWISPEYFISQEYAQNYCEENSDIFLEVSLLNTGETK